jgi:hypothetical protein
MLAKVGRPLRRVPLGDPNRKKDIRADLLELNFQSHSFPVQTSFCFVNNIIINNLCLRFVGYNLRIFHHRHYIILYVRTMYLI